MVLFCIVLPDNPKHLYESVDADDNDDGYAYVF